MTTFIRYLFSYCIYAVTLYISWSIVGIVQAIFYVTIKPFSPDLYRKCLYYSTLSIYSELDFIVTWYSNSKIDVYLKKTDLKFLGKEHACVVSNHTYEIDWLFAISLSREAHIVGNYKSYIKISAIYVPLLGLTFFFSDFILMRRSFDKDKKTIQSKIAELMEYSDPIWIILYPEGTRFHTKRHKESIKFAQEMGLPVLKHHLTPKPKGFLTSLPIFRRNLKAIYDIVWSVDPNDEVKPDIINIFFGKQVKVKLYMNRIPLEEIPQDENDATKFLNDLFVEKDKIQENFFKTGQHFPNSEKGNFTQFRIKKSYTSLFITIGWMVLILPLFWYYILATFFSSIYHASFMSIILWLAIKGFQKGMNLGQVKKK